NVSHYNYLYGIRVASAVEPWYHGRNLHPAHPGTSARESKLMDIKNPQPRCLDSGYFNAKYPIYLFLPTRCPPRRSGQDPSTTLV
ncbi:hypothetical protein RSAG8_13425, partial [Rhizoctonia solani AG-8 WAC10335]